MDPRHRLHRRYPGQGKGDLRPMARRLGERATEPPPERSVPGESIRMRETKARHPWRMADPAPNAPLLKRMVRYPYRQDLTYARRERVFEPLALVDWGVEDRPNPFREAQSDRNGQTNGNPLKNYSFRVAPRAAAPGVAEWIAGRKT